MKPLEVFYDECIQSKILKCDLRASRVKRGSHCTRHRAEINRAQAAFFEDNKEQLVQKMLSNGVGRDLAKINASLIKAFLEVFSAKVFSIESERQYLELLYEAEEYPRDEFSNGKMAERTHECYCHVLEPDRVQYLYELPRTYGALIDEDSD